MALLVAYCTCKDCGTIFQKYVTAPYYRQVRRELHKALKSSTKCFNCRENERRPKNERINEI